MESTGRGVQGLKKLRGKNFEAIRNEAVGSECIWCEYIASRSQKVQSHKVVNRRCPNESGSNRKGPNFSFQKPRGQIPEVPGSNATQRSNHRSIVRMSAPKYVGPTPDNVANSPAGPSGPKRPQTIMSSGHLASWPSGLMPHNPEGPNAYGTKPSGSKPWGPNP